MRRDSQVTTRAFVASFLGVALSFTAGIAAAQLFAFRIHSAARDITENSSPSVVWLASMRSSVRQLHVRLDDYVGECKASRCSPHPPRQVAELRRDARKLWDEYRALPTFPGESDLWPSVSLGLERLDDAVALTVSAVAAGDVGRAEGSLGTARGLVDQVDAELAALIRFDHEQGLIAARRIDRLARWGIATSALLDALSVALTVIASVLLVRIVRRYEGSLRSRARELDAFAGRVAHDVKSPLGSAALALDAARAEVTERGRARLDRAKRSIVRAQRLVDALLEFARAGAEPSPGTSAGVREVLEDVVAELHPVADENGVELQVEAMPADDSVAVSPGVLTSILSNLVRNAIVHMGSSDVRKVRIRSAPADRTDALRIEVEDTGPGIPEALSGRMFEPFVRGPDAQHPGSGLGLATASRFVTGLGGRIGFRSRPGSGATFWVELPRRDVTPGTATT
jgi:signal transduction histidine kinase